MPSVIVALLMLLVLGAVVFAFVWVGTGELKKLRDSEKRGM